MKAKCRSKAQRLSSDIISTLPQPIIETILCLLPIEEAARTGILSRDWRYKWTTIPKLVFHMGTMSKRTRKKSQTSDLASATKNMNARCKLFYAIHQVLLLRQGPIHEFTLRMEADHHYFEIDQIIFHLSRNHALKKLTLDMGENQCYKLPICAISLHQLRNLHLSHVILDHQPILIGGFRNLRTLCLFDASISTNALLHLLSNCPSLTSFTLNINEFSDGKDCTIIELYESLPVVIEYLDIRLGFVIVMLVPGSLSKELPISLINLKYVCLRQMWLVNDDLRFVLLLIKCSPNLEKIRLLELEYELVHANTTYAGILEEYSDVWLEHLNELEIASVSDYNHQMEFVKFIVARSPKLKKVRISFECNTVRQKSDILKDVSKALLKIPRASPVEIVVARTEDMTFSL